MVRQENGISLPWKMVFHAGVLTELLLLFFRPSKAFFPAIFDFRVLSMVLLPHRRGLNKFIYVAVGALPDIAILVNPVFQAGFKVLRHPV